MPTAPCNLAAPAPKWRMTLIGFLLLAMSSVACADVAAPDKPQARISQEQARAKTQQVYERLIRAKDANTAELALFVSLMPKGGDLHHHYTGSIYAETYLDWVQAQGFCVYKADAPEFKVQRLRIENRPLDTLPVAQQALCAKAPEVIADGKLYRDLLMTWSDKDYYNHSHTQPPPDQQFFNTFGFFGPAAGYKPNLGLKALKQRALAENQQYLETMLRSAPEPDLGEWAAKIDALSSDTPAAEVNALLAQVFKQLQQDTKAQDLIAKHVGELAQTVEGLDDERFTLRLQTYISRGNSLSRSFAGLYAAFVVAQKSPFVVGVNIVGPENGDAAMRNYRMHMRMMGFLKSQFPQTRLSLHAGELTMGMVPPEGLRFHISEAIEVAGADRIGHGIDIAHEDNADKLLRSMASKKVAVEVNLTSNEFILGVKNEQHPVLLYRKFGVPHIISTDDAGVSRSTLGNEYLLFTSRYRPAYAELKDTVFNSIRYSFLDKATKERELAKLSAAFAQFEQRIASWSGKQSPR